MTKEQTLQAAEKFLLTVYKYADVKHYAALVNALANAKNGHSTRVVIDALEGVRDFVDELIQNLQEDEKNSKVV